MNPIISFPDPAVRVSRPGKANDLAQRLPLLPEKRIEEGGNARNGGPLSIGPAEANNRGRCPEKKKT